MFDHFQKGEYNNDDDDITLSSFLGIESYTYIVFGIFFSIELQ
jgi:hypothetical protein